MSLDAVIQRILDRGKAEADAIVGAAKQGMEKSLQQARETGQHEVSRRVAEARSAAEKLRMQERARAELEARRIVLSSQKDVLDAVRKEVLGRLDDRETNARTIKTLLDGYVADWRSGKVYCRAEDEELVRGIVKSRFGGTIECAGGIVIESDDGTRRIDLKYESFLQDIWEDSVKGLADLLWTQR